MDWCKYNPCFNFQVSGKASETIINWIYKRTVAFNFEQKNGPLATIQVFEVTDLKPPTKRAETSCRKFENSSMSWNSYLKTIAQNLNSHLCWWIPRKLMSSAYYSFLCENGYEDSKILVNIICSPRSYSNYDTLVCCFSSMFISNFYKYVHCQEKFMLSECNLRIWWISWLIWLFLLMQFMDDAVNLMNKSFIDR